MQIDSLKHNRILVYRDQLLAYSETFIKNQATRLNRYDPYFVGSKRVGHISLPDHKVFVVNKGGTIGYMCEALYKKCGFAPNLLSEVGRINPVLVHVHFGSCATRFMPLWKKLNLPLIVTFHGRDVTSTDEALKKSSWLIDKQYLKRREELAREGTMFIAVSSFIKEMAVSRGYPEERLLVHYIGVDTSWFRPDYSVLREPVVLFVGRLVEVKGCRYLIQAMEHVQSKQPEIKLVVIGDGPLRLELEKMANERLRNFRFLGVQTSEQVKAWMNRSKLFCVPSVIASSGDAEGFGMVFAEAQSMELPVVSFSSGGIPEAVAHGETGLLAPQRDVKMLSDHILTLFRNEELWRRFSKAGRKRVCEKFDLTTQTEKLEKIYDRVVLNN